MALASKGAGVLTSNLAKRSLKVAKPQMQEVFDRYILTANSRGFPPKQVPSKLNGTFEYFTSPYEQHIFTWTPTYVVNAAKKEVLEKVPWLAPAAFALFGSFYYAQNFKRMEDLHHRY